ncbi:MAG: hypothetical protein ACK4ME_02315 [Fimbriimonadales bacterium]
MREVLEQLQQAIQHTLALGLNRPGGLEPLRDAQRALQRYDALEPLVETLQAVLDAPDTRTQLNALTRLHYACGQCLARLQIYALPHMSEPLADEPTRQVAAPAVSEPFARLFRGEASLLEALPAIREQVWSWQPDAPILPLQLALAHSGTAYLAIERLQSLGEAALEVIIQLTGSKSAMVRLRACELLLDHTEPTATAALRGALPHTPRALPMFQKLRRRPDLHPIFVKDDTPPLSAWAGTLMNREQFQQMLSRCAVQIMLEPSDSPVVAQLIERAQQVARSDYDSMRLLAMIPHEQATQQILNIRELPTVWLIHLCGTLDYRLTPLVLSLFRAFDTPESRAINLLGDAAFLPWIIRTGQKDLSAYGEAVSVLQRDANA